MKNLSIVVALLALGSAPAMAMPLSESALHPGWASIVDIADGFFVPPADPDAPPLSEESVQSAVDQKLQKKFNEAARGTNSLTVQGASDASWGVIADHFAEIDGNHDGYASFDEIQTFFDGRSPLPAARARAAAKVQVVE
ncbi:hypothetical protein [Phyllobacterium bourgognense]|uniref:EF-hand domain-containing protein n=1 Tax=Phyllobacterium bourgognense TaxID=314236 RepID=A0A368YYZ1_9HYPH|nr:hypothetical protein [Phyllobacterium bourgognense]RCW85420.1 hypothetical protein C7476_103263 [Phyllobacterium bourgognense]